MIQYTLSMSKEASWLCSGGARKGGEDGHYITWGTTRQSFCPIQPTGWRKEMPLQDATKMKTRAQSTTGHNGGTLQRKLENLTVKDFTTDNGGSWRTGQIQLN